MEVIDKNEVVKDVIDRFEEKGLEVTHANFGGHRKPDEVQNVRPDVIAWDNDKDLYHIAAVTRAEVFDKADTIDKIKVLSNLMMGKGRSKDTRIPFYLAMPKGQLEKIDEKLDQYNLERKNVLPMEC